MVARAYYAGGARVVVDGIPLRLARRPSPTYARWLKEREKASEFYNRQERANERAKEAKRAMQIYAETLGIELAAAKLRIDAQRLHVLDNPLIDLSLEYDL